MTASAASLHNTLYQVGVKCSKVRRVADKQFHLGTNNNTYMYKTLAWVKAFLSRGLCMGVTHSTQQVELLPLANNS